MLIFRRWKIALPLLLLAIGATLFVAFTAKPDYTMTSYVQFIPAKVAPSDNPTSASLRNPWNQLGLNTLGQASIYATQDQGFLESLKASHHTNNFTLTMTYPNPIVTVEVVGKDPADARDTTELIIGRLRSSAESLQRGSGVGDTDIIATQRLDRGQNLLPSRSKVKRAILAVAAAGLVVTAGGTVGFDALMRRRARKRRELEGELPDGRPLAEGGMAKAGAHGAKGKEGVAGVPVAGGLPDARPFGGPTGDGGPRAAPPESLERTAIIIKRTSSIVKPPQPPKQQRRSPAATYRSANAQHVEGESGTGGADEGVAAGTDVDKATESSSDARTPRQSEWVTSEKNGKAQ